MNRPENSSKSRSQAWQLLRIARLELDRPLETTAALVWGEGETAEELLALLKEDALSAQGAHILHPPQPCENRFDLLVLLCPMPPELLDNLIAPGGLTLDACAQQSGEWIVFDQGASYRRIRVLSLMR
jgi:hypothetical protein